MSASRQPGFLCPFCKSRFVREDGFRQGRRQHVRTYHFDKYDQFLVDMKTANKVGDFRAVFNGVFESDAR